MDDNLLGHRPGYFGKINLQLSLESGGLSRTCELLRYLADHMSETMDRLTKRYPRDRVAVVIGTTTTGIREVEAQPTVAQVDYHRHQELAAVSEYMGKYCGFDGPNITVSTACTSGAKALGLAKSLIEADWCDAAIAGAGESLNRLTCSGFDALESYAAGYSKAFQSDRDGINIGEGAALFSLEKRLNGIALAGFSETSDAWHETAPDPDGVHAAKAIRAALAEANILQGDIGYINLHGTGTIQNDAMEAKIISEIFDTRVAASTTKPVTGHILGAAGAVEAAILWLLLAQPCPVSLPPQYNVEYYDPGLPVINLVRSEDNPPRILRSALSTSFAFGGHNTALVLARV